MSLIKQNSMKKAARAVALLAIVSAAGCADMITYSNDSRREGTRLVREENYTDAAGAFRNATRQNPLDYESYGYLGDVEAQQNRHQQAIAAYKISLGVQKKTSEGRQDVDFRFRTLNGLAQVIARHDPNDVETAGIDRQAQESNAAEDWYLLGRIHGYRGDADNAVQNLTKAYKLDPKNYYYSRDLGLYLESIGQNTQAIGPLQRAYALSPSDTTVSDALRRLGVVPGPSLKEQNQLTRPLFPRGPLPDLPTRRDAGLDPENATAGAPVGPPIRD